MKLLCIDRIYRLPSQTQKVCKTEMLSFDVNTPGSREVACCLAAVLPNERRRALGLPEQQEERIPVVHWGSQWTKLVRKVRGKDLLASPGTLDPLQRVYSRNGGAVWERHPHGFYGGCHGVGCVHSSTCSCPRARISHDIKSLLFCKELIGICSCTFMLPSLSRLQELLSAWQDQGGPEGHNSNYATCVGWGNRRC